MSNDFLPFALPEISNDEIDEVVSTLRSGWVTTGPKVREFEAGFAAWLGGGVDAISVNSATAGLHLGLEALGVGPGDQVITTTHTFTATAEVVRYLGADPVFVDIDPKTLCIDAEAIIRVLSPRTKVIIPVHFGGLAADMGRVLSIARERGISVMEDAAHALPTSYEGKLIGSLDSDITVFSFYANKTITTGEGGMVVTRSKDLAKRIRTMRLHGISRDAFDRFTSNRPSWYYEIVAPGFKYNMTDIAASIGIHQLKKANDFQERRAQIASSYCREFYDLPIILPPLPKLIDLHSWHLFVIQLRDGCGISRDMFIERMFDLGIGCSVHYIPLHLQPYWRDTYGLSPKSFPVSQFVYEHSVSLPIYSSMSDSDIRKVISAVRSIFE